MVSVRRAYKSEDGCIEPLKNLIKIKVIRQNLSFCHKNRMALYGRFERMRKWEKE